MNRKNILYALYLFFIVFVLLEIILRIYNPFHFRLKGNKIILPVNQTEVIRNDINPRLDKIIINKRNSLGFRGPEKPLGFENVLSIITVGGSTTECHFLSDEKTWPYLLGQALKPHLNNLWINNAGFDGHSTFGHQVLLNDYLVRIKPKIILFLVGINDIENDHASFHDKLNMKGGYPDFKHFIFTNSEVLNVILNLVRGRKAQKMNNTTGTMIDLRNGKQLLLEANEVDQRIKDQEKYLVNFRRRIVQLIDTCRSNSIMPIFITQPNMFGEGVDPVTGVNLETFALKDGFNGKALWRILQLYNQNVKNICSAKGVPVIDLASLLPKSSLYFYDGSHYTNQGAQKVADILATELKPLIIGTYPQYRK